jgi:GT2 family glycosyltransferase
MKRITYLIVTYKAKQNSLTKLVRALGQRDLLIIKNANDNIPYDGKRINIQQMEQNIGFGPAVNKGFEYITQSNKDWVVLVNQDISLSETNIEDFELKLNNLEPGIAGTVRGSLDPNRWTTRLDDKGSEKYISGSFMAIHRDVIDKVGLFYEPYFLYYEEVDYCIRAARAGFPIIHVPVEGIHHDDATTLGKGSFAHQYYLARNHMLFVERLAPWRVKIYELVRFPKTIWEHVVRGEDGALRGIRDYLLRRFGPLKE